MLRILFSKKQHILYLQCRFQHLRVMADLLDKLQPSQQVSQIIVCADGTVEIDEFGIVHPPDVLRQGGFLEEIHLLTQLAAIGFRHGQNLVGYDAADLMPGPGAENPNLLGIHGKAFRFQCRPDKAKKSGNIHPVCGEGQIVAVARIDDPTLVAVGADNFVKPPHHKIGKRRRRGSALRQMSTERAELGQQGCHRLVIACLGKHSVDLPVGNRFKEMGNVCLDHLLFPYVWSGVVLETHALSVSKAHRADLLPLQNVAENPALEFHQ